MAKKETFNQQRKRLRAGKIKCRRCRQIFVRSKGEKWVICERCRERCSRCDILLTKENKVNNHTTKNVYRCKPCKKEADKHTTPEGAREYGLLKKYGITVNEYEEILADHNGTCWICDRPPKTKRLHVDHEHVPKDKQKGPRERREKVRGLLCWGCNAAIAKFKDNPERMRKAAEYIETRPAQKILGS